MANPATYRRKRVILSNNPQSPHIIPSLHQRHISRNVDTQRTGMLTGSLEKGPAYHRRTPLLPDMGLVLLTEISKGAQHRVRGSLPQAAEGTGFNLSGQVL
jgi:hypothetical protein